MPKLFTEYAEHASETAFLYQEACEELGQRDVPTNVRRHMAEALYCGCQLASEAGEVSGALAKMLRKKKWRLGKEDQEKIKDELGDVLWYIVQIAHIFELDLPEIAQYNLRKLAERHEETLAQRSNNSYTKCAMSDKWVIPTKDKVNIVREARRIEREVIEYDENAEDE